MNNYDLNPAVNKAPPDPKALQPGQVCQTGRKSTANERSAKSLADQRRCTQAVADRYGLPSGDDDWLPEKIGFGGDCWWEGGGQNGLEEPDTKRKVRPVLTQIMRQIIAGEIRAVICWNLDRLWRSVSICQAMIMILYKHNCLLFTFDGPVNIWTYEGRNSILQNAIASQAVSESARINSPRGVFENLNNGILATSPNGQGFRTAGQGTKRVLHMQEEQKLVNRIYEMSDQGMSDDKICKVLMAEGIQLYAESGGKHPNGFDRAPGNEMVVRTSNIHDILRDCRYVGRQRYRTKQQKERGEKGKEYPCDEFLRTVERDGEIVKDPVVPYDLWDRVQAKNDANARIGHRGVNYRALSSLVRCAIDGEALNAQEEKMQDGSKVSYWIMKKTRPGCRCQCRVTTVRENTLTDYIADVLGPLMLEEINGRVAGGTHDPHALTRGRLQQELKSAEDFRNGRLLKMLEDEIIDPELLRDKSKEVKERIERLQRQIRDLAPPKSQPGEANAAAVFKNLRAAPEAAVRDAVRQCLCWIAVLPGDGVREPKPGYGPGTTDVRYSYAPAVAGKLVFLTAWGTYHTAILCRTRTGPGTGRRRTPFTLRPATVEETIGGVADFPQPQCFFEGLARAWAGRVYNWSPDKFAPGWHPEEFMPVAEFVA